MIVQKADTFYPQAAALQGITEELFSEQFQITAENPMVGVSSRVKLWNAVGQQLGNGPQIFGSQGRPGNMVGMFTTAGLHGKERKSISILT